MILAMIDRAKDVIFGRGGGLATSELRKLTERTSFSKYLPYVAYEEETKTYFNSDNTVGFIWECSPLCFAGDKSIDTIIGIFSAGLRLGSIMQFTLFADPYIKDYVDVYKSMKTRDLALVRRTTEAFGEFLMNAVNGINNCAGIPLRTFRLFVSVKMPLTKEEYKAVFLDPNYNSLYDVLPWMKDLYSNLNEILDGSVLHPKPFPPNRLIDMMRRILNDRDFEECAKYDETIPIRKQMIMSETVIDAKNLSEIKVGNKVFRCITPKSFPPDGDALQTNELFGGIWGVISDAEQIRTPFIYSLGIIFHDLEKKLHTKCNITLQQKAVGSFAPSLMRKQTEYLEATDELTRKVPFVRVMPIFWTWGKDSAQVGESISRVKRIWQSRGYVMQEDKGILVALFQSVFPFGIIDDGDNIETLQRDFYFSSKKVPAILPIQSDFSGGGAPVMIFSGRKGEISTLDLFNKLANNHNFYCAATSGSGKSFLINYITYNQFANNGIVRLIDIGRSYRKMTKMLGAQFIDFTDDANICINPFSGITDIKTDTATISSIVLQMIFSATDHIPNDIAETGSTLVKEAVKWAFDQRGTEAGIDDVHAYLEQFPRLNTDYNPAEAGNLSSAAMEDFKKIAHTMAYNLRDFTSPGIYGKWFNGPATLDISQDEFVVLEVDGLRSRKELFKVVVLQIINAVTQDLYLSDRSRPRLVIFDESYEFIRGDNRFLGDIIESGYRRARKYAGSFGIVTQSINDLATFGSIGNVIRANSAFNFYLESVDFEKARDAKLLECDPFTLRLLKSVKTVRGKYSEIFMDTPYGKGVVRLVVDPFSYFVYTSAADEYSEIEAMVDKGLSYEEAIENMVRKRFR